MDNLPYLIGVISIVIIVMVMLTLGVYYLAMRGNVKRRKEAFQYLHTNLAKGDQVEFSNGLIGTVQTVGTEYCDIAIKSGGVITVSRYAISRIIED